MKWTSTSILVALLLITFEMTVPMNAAEPPQAAAMKRVYVLNGTKPAKVPADSLVRISAQGIAGSEITARLTGPAKAEQVQVVQLQDGEQTVGTLTNEFLITPSGKGKVQVAVTVTYPTGGDPLRENYVIHFE